MNVKQIALAFVLADFLGLTAYAVYVHGYIGVFQLILANSATTLAAVDLTIALSLISVWVWQDAKRRGISPIPYLVVTLALGSAGPLLYLIRTLGAEAPQAVGGRAPARSLA